ncbi:MAG: MBL fold metallo-hydrolase [Planctomycetes bacterium]|nr:MBL fold metallo-hydrolase [Planctomycetota bacterium]MCB9869096.1 MBL fold metallo-hydrolase [Planctomycetota bacterium]MCB9889269.1 MBL fold metallo-hydrolase [Planctomycetota bacterium]
MTITLQFIGAARFVTGSKHLLTVNGKNVLLDCGMVQGPRKIANKANQDLGLRDTRVDAVVLSHAHIDHSGSLPRLVKLGFSGEIHCTPATKDLMEILLTDSAHIQAQDAKHLRRRGHAFDPPYDLDDVEKTVKRTRTHGYHEPFDVVPGVKVQFLDSGHILGSAFVVIDVDDGQRQQRIVFTGDHGRRGIPILRDPERLPECDVLITEATYGDRLHAKRVDLESSLEQVVNEEERDGGRILIPAFSVGRTQNVLMYLGKLLREKRIRPQPIYIDSPMSKKVTQLTARYPELFDADMQELLRSGHDPFFFEGVRYVADVEESKSLNDLRQGIILAASGMCEAGRILHHLKQSVTRPEDCVLAVGYMAQGTLGRKLIDGYEHVNILGERYAVRCKVRSISGLSAHADYGELLSSFRHLAPRARVFVVHGEEDATLKFADKLLDAGFTKVDVPVKREKFEV